MYSKRRSGQSPKLQGFTLVEVLIVVVIMAVLAATIIPQFSDSAKDAKISSAKFNLHTLRSQVELYKSQHDGTLPGGALTELISKTNRDGEMTGTGDFPYGPYVRDIPNNPFNNLNSVRAVTAAPTIGTAADGWIFNTETGEIWLDVKEQALFDDVNK